MYKQILNSEIKGLSSEAKLWLVQFVLALGRAPSGAITAAAMRRSTGLSHHLFTQAWGQLKRGAYLERKGVPAWTGAGADKCYVYKLGRQTLSLLEEATPADHSQWDSLVRGLLFGEIEPNQIVLRAGGRLLLASLYARADEFGVVKSLGIASLRRLTGLNENRLKIQLAKLKAIEHLRSVVSGASGASLFGRAGGAYFLNIGSERLGAYRRRVSIFVDTRAFNCGHIGIERLDASYVERLCGDVHEALSHPGDPLYSLRRFRGLSSVGKMDRSAAFWFLELGRKEVREYQQYKMEEYTSRLLSDHWDLVAAGVSPDSEMLSGLREVILLQFRDEGMGGDGKYVSSWAKAEAVDALMRLALLMAKDIQQEMMGFPAYPVDQMKYCILPRSVARVTWPCTAVMLLPTDGHQASGQCFVATAWAERPRDTEILSSESAIPLTSRYRYGLLSSPMAGPKRYRSGELRQIVRESLL